MTSTHIHWNRVLLVLALLLFAGFGAAQTAGGLDITDYFLEIGLAAAAIAGLVKLLRETVWKTLDGPLVRLVSIGLGGALAVLAHLLGLTPEGWTLAGALTYGLSAGAAAFLGVDALRAGTGHDAQQVAAKAAGLAALTPAGTPDPGIWNTQAGRFIERYLRSILPEALLPVVKQIVQGIVAEAVGRAWNAELAGELQAKVRSVLISLNLIKANRRGPRLTP